MYYFDKRLQYPVKVTEPDPLFARMLQQAIGGIEGEIRVCMQYFFQAWGSRGPTSKVSRHAAAYGDGGTRPYRDAGRRLSP